MSIFQLQPHYSIPDTAFFLWDLNSGWVSLTGSWGSHLQVLTVLGEDNLSHPLCLVRAHRESLVIAEPAYTVSHTHISASMLQFKRL